jgi:hypothetical protein
MPSLAPNLPASLLVFTLLFFPALASASAPFSAQLDATDHAAAGLTKLSAEQRAALDSQIERELTVARQGNVVAFSRSFLQRRTSDQVAAAGLATLSPEERATLDRFVARAVAQRPAVLVPTLAARAKTADDTVIETVTYKPQLHGEVTLTVGTAGSGRTFYGGSFTTVYEDPQRNFSVAFTYAEYHGKGLPYFGDDCSDPRFGRGPFRR